MTYDPAPVSEDELHAYVDGELPPDRAEAVAAWLASHDEAASLVAAWRAQADAIRARYGGTADEPVPARLKLDRVIRRRHSWIAVATAACIAAFAAGGATGWFAHGAAVAPSESGVAVAGDALDAYKLYVAEVRHPVEVPGEDRAHIRQWLSKRLGYQLIVPDLQHMGLKLVGGRLLPSGTGAPAAFYMYESQNGERFTMYSAGATGADTALHFRGEDKVAAFYWIDKSVAYAVSGPADRDRLETITKAIYDQVEKGDVRKL